MHIPVYVGERMLMPPKRIVYVELRKPDGESITLFRSSYGKWDVEKEKLLTSNPHIKPWDAWKYLRWHWFLVCEDGSSIRIPKNYVGEIEPHAGMYVSFHTSVFESYAGDWEYYQFTYPAL